MVTNTAPSRPVALAPDPDGIPVEMKARSQWVLWRYEFRQGRWTKVPYNPRTGRAAACDNAATWGTFADAWEGFRRGGYDGLGYVTTEVDGLLILDFDGCVRPDGTVEPWADLYTARLGCVELSPSGGGLHAFVGAERPWGDDGCYKVFSVRDVVNHGKNPQVEMLFTHRYVAVTGRAPDGAACAIADGRECAERLYGWLCTQGGAGRDAGSNTQKSRGPDRYGSPAPLSPSMTDEEIMLRARNARNGAKFIALCDEGNLAAHGGDGSSADMGLCCMFAFWTQDTGQIDRLFRGSKLLRPKWDDVHYGDGATYGEGTIRKALKQTREHYSPTPEPDGEPASGASVDEDELGQDSTQGKQWKGPSDWLVCKPVTPEQARAMSRQQLEAYVVTWSRWQYDLYHLLTNEAQVVDPDTGKTRPVLTTTDKVVTACAWLQAHRAPGVEYPAERPRIHIYREDIARTAGVSPSTVSRTLDHVAETGFVIKDRRTVVRDGQCREELWLGVPAEIPRNTDPLAVDAPHRAKDRQRKRCPDCGGSIFVHKTMTSCGACGKVLDVDVQVDGDDDVGVEAVRARLAGRP